MTKEKAKKIQRVLWTALILLQMAMVNCLKVHAETVRKEVTYQAVEEEGELPQEITVSVLAKEDEEDVTCQAVEWLEEASYWQDDFSFPMTFYEYGADTYQLGDRVLKADELSVLAAQYGEEILTFMGLSPEEYEVTDLLWNGDAYQNEEGVICRDARGVGRRLLRDYRVVYEGSVDPERWKELRRDSTWKAETEMASPVEEESAPEETKTEETQKQIETTVTIQKESETETQPERIRSKVQKFFEKVTQIFLVAVGIGALFFFGGLFVLACMRIGRKLREYFKNR